MCQHVVVQQAVAVLGLDITCVVKLRESRYGIFHVMHETHFKKLYVLIYLFILVAIFIRNLLLYFTYFSDDYIYYHFMVY